MDAYARYQQMGHFSQYRPSTDKAFARIPLCRVKRRMVVAVTAASQCNPKTTVSQDHGLLT
jgi:hypothetical protein